MNAACPAGLYPATVTPFTDTMEIDYQALETHLGETSEAEGVQGLAVNGHLGEILALTGDERAAVVRVARSVCRTGQPILSGIVGNHVEDLVEQGLRAKTAGADGLLVLPPIDVRPYRRLAGNAESVLHFFNELNRRVGLPMVVHQYPTFTGAAYPLDILLRLTELEHVVGIKAASVDITDYTELWDTLSRKTQVLVATDAPGMLGMLLHGSHGALIGIAAIEPALWGRLLRLVSTKEYDHAQELFRGSCLPLMDAIFENQVPRGFESEASATKEALVQMGRLPSSRVRLPAVGVAEPRKRAIADALERSGLRPAACVVEA